MKEFNDLLFKEHPNGFGFQSVMKFENGYGVSVVCGSFYYCSPREDLYAASMYDTYEVAVLKDGSLCYDTPITDDVMGHLTTEEVSDVMKQVQSLN